MQNLFSKHAVRLNAMLRTGIGAYVLLLMGLLATLPSGAEDETPVPVKKLDPDLMAGRWYEIARYPHWFEKTLTDVSAICLFKENNRVEVRTTAYNPDDEEWRRLKGVGKHHGPEGSGQYRLRFIWPFTRTYTILYVDREERHTKAIVVSNKGHAWILARDPELPDDVYEGLLKKAKELGIETDRLQKVKHKDRAPPPPDD